MKEEKEGQAVQKENAFAVFFGWLVTAVCFVLIGWFAHKWMPERKEQQKGPPPQKGVLVTVEEAKLLPFNPIEDFVAHVESIKEVDILPQIDGYITEVLFGEGSTVKEGDVLFRIDPERYSATLALRKSELAKAEASVEQAEAEVDRAERYFTRLQKADARGITQTDKDTAETSYAAAKAGLLQAKAGVTQAKANIALAEFDMKHTEVKAPISGQIGKALVHVGDYVAPSKGAMARIVQMDPIRVTFPMTDRAYISFRGEMSKEGDSLMGSRRSWLVLPNGSIYDKEGKWDFADNEMSSETATMLVRLSFPNPNGVLVPNTFVKLMTELSNPPKCVQVPDTTLLDFADGLGVWIVQEDGTAAQRLVKVRGSYKGLSAISEGLEAGEKVVNEGCHKVQPGSALRIKGEEAAPAAGAPAETTEATQKK